MGGVLGGLVATGAGSWLGLGGASKTSDALTAGGQAQLDAANQQVKMAQDAYEKQLANRAEGIRTAQDAARMSPGEITSINKIFETQEQSLKLSLSSINKQQEALNQIDPQVRAAGQNFYDLLTGQSAAILKPLQTQMDNQRKSLTDKLAAQMGPGFMASSAGVQALVQFDNQAALTLGSAQMQALQTVGNQYQSLVGLQQQGQASIGSQTQNAFAQSQGANQLALGGYSAAQNRFSNATLGAMSANPLNPFGVAEAQKSVIASAGLPFAGQAYYGQAQSALGGALFGQGLGMLAGPGGGGGKNPFSSGGGGGGATAPAGAGDFLGPTAGIETSAGSMPFVA